MKAHHVALVALAGVLAGTGPARGAAGTTVLAVAERASDAARQWQADAVLTSASTLQGKSDGTAEAWSFLFYSPKSGKALSVDVKGAKVATLEVRPHVTDPVGKFIDSDRAVQEAKKHGLKGAGPLNLSVMWMGQATKRPAACWTVGAGFETGDVSVVLDAVSGALVTRQEIP